MSALTIHPDSVLTMTTAQIAEYTAKEHAHVLRDAEAMFAQLVTMGEMTEEGVSKFGSTYLDRQSRPQRCLVLPKDLCLLLVSGYNLRLRKQIIDRWIELERGAQANALQAFNVPTNFREALALALQIESQREQLAAQVVEMTPKAEFHDAVADSHGMQTVQEVAKVLGVGPNNLFRMLRESRLLMGDNLPFQNHLGRYFAVREYNYVDGKGENRVGSRTYVLPKGLIYIENLVRNTLRQSPPKPAETQNGEVIH